MTDKPKKPNPAPASEELKTWSVHLSSHDFACIHYLREHNSLSSMATAVRFAIEKQAERDKLNEQRPLPQRLQRLYKRVMRDDVVQMCSGRWERRNASMPPLDEPSETPTTPWCLRVTPTIHEAMEFIISQHDELTRLSEALRFSLRVQARLDGFTPVAELYNEEDVLP